MPESAKVAALPNSSQRPKVANLPQELKDQSGKKTVTYDHRQDPSGRKNPIQNIR